MDSHDPFDDDAREQPADGMNGTHVLPDGDPETGFAILEHHTLTAIRAQQPEPVIPGLLTRQATTLISAAGGTGKTCLVMQLAIEASLGLPLFGSDEFTPERALKVLYVNAEDALPIQNYWLGKILPYYGCERVPFHLAPVADGDTGEFLLDGANARYLADVVTTGGYDVLILDTAIAFMPMGIKWIDPGAIRTFLRQALGVLQRRSRCAIVLLVHDNKQGQAVSGTADWLNFARLVLHLERGADRPGETALTLTTEKSNLGWQYKKVLLTREHATLTSTVTELQRYDDGPGGVVDATTTLSTIVRRELLQLPADRRTKLAVRAFLYEKARPLGITRQDVRDFIDSRLTWEEQRVGRVRYQTATGLFFASEDTP